MTDKKLLDNLQRMNNNFDFDPPSMNLKDNVYNYADDIPFPNKELNLGDNNLNLGVTDDGDLNKTIADGNAVIPYMNLLLFGENKLRTNCWNCGAEKYNAGILGKNAVIQSGTCGIESDAECAGKPRYIFVRNIPTGKIPCVPPDPASTTSMKGMVPGIIEDIVDVNPYATFLNFLGKGAQVNQRCVKQTFNVGTNLRPDFKSYCAPVYVPGGVPCMPEISSLFTDYGEFKKMKKRKKNKKKKNEKMIIMLVVIVMILIIFILFLKTK